MDLTPAEILIFLVVIVAIVYALFFNQMPGRDHRYEQSLIYVGQPVIECISPEDT